MFAIYIDHGLLIQFNTSRPNIILFFSAGAENTTAGAENTTAVAGMDTLPVFTLAYYTY